MASLTDRLVAVLGDVLTIDAESDGALTVRYDGTVASLRVVPITDGLDLVSLTQIVGWDLPANKKLRDKVADHGERTVLGALAVVEKPAEAAGGRRNTAKTADVMLRYNFPGSGLTNDALCTMVLLVLDKGVEIRQSLQG